MKQRSSSRSNLKVKRPFQISEKLTFDLQIWPWTWPLFHGAIKAQLIYYHRKCHNFVTLVTDIFTLEAVDILSFLSLVILICCSSSFIFNFRFSFSDRASSSAWKNESKIEKSSWLSTVFGFSPKCLAVLCNVLSIFWRAFVSSASRGSADEQNADKVGTSLPSVNEALNINSTSVADF